MMLLIEVIDTNKTKFIVYLIFKREHNFPQIKKITIAFLDLCCL